MSLDDKQDLLIDILNLSIDNELIARGHTYKEKLKYEGFIPDNSIDDQTIEMFARMCDSHGLSYKFEPAIFRLGLSSYILPTYFLTKPGLWIKIVNTTTKDLKYKLKKLKQLYGIDCLVLNQESLGEFFKNAEY